MEEHNIYKAEERTHGICDICKVAKNDYSEKPTLLIKGHINIILQNKVRRELKGKMPSLEEGYTQLWHICSDDECPECNLQEKKDETDKQ